MSLSNQKDWCRVLPEFVANNFEYFDLISGPKLPVKNPIQYNKLLKIKIKKLKKELTDY